MRELTPERRRELLGNSCERLPNLLDLDAPADIVCNEIRILIGHAMVVLGEQMRKEIRRHPLHPSNKTAATESEASDGKS